MLADQGIGLGIVGGPLRHVGLGGPIGKQSGDVRELGAKTLVRTGAEVDVQEVRDVRVVGAPAEQEQRELAGGLICEERGVVLDHELDADAEVFLELRLEVCRDLIRAGEVAPDLRPVVEVVGLREVEARGRQHRLGLGRVECRPLRSAAGERDGARSEVLGGFRAGRVEVLGDPGAIDADRDGLPDGLLVPWRLVDVHPHVEDVEGLAGEQLEARIGRNRGEILGPDVVDTVGGAGLQLLEPLGGLRAPLDDDGLGLRARRAVPVVGVRLEGDVVAGDPLLDAVGAGAVRRLDVALAGRVGLEPVRVLDVVRGERDLRQEGDIRGAEVELDREAVERLDLADRARVVGWRLRAIDRGGRIRLAGVGRGRDPRGGRRASRWRRACRASTCRNDDRRARHENRELGRPPTGTGHATPPQQAPGASGPSSGNAGRTRATTLVRRECGEA